MVKSFVVQLLPNGFQEVLPADAGNPHVPGLFLAIGIEQRSFSFRPAADRIAVKAGLAKKGMNKHEGETGKGSGKKGRGADDHPAEDRSEHDDDDVIESRPFAEGPNTGDPQKNKRKEKGYDGPADHLKTVEITSVPEKGVDNIHGRLFSLGNAKAVPDYSRKIKHMKKKKTKKVTEDRPNRAEIHHGSTTQGGSDFGQGSNDLGKHADKQGSESNEGANYSNEQGWNNEALRKEDT